MAAASGAQPASQRRNRKIRDSSTHAKTVKNCSANAWVTVVQKVMGAFALRQYLPALSLSARALLAIIQILCTARVRLAM
jgi:hypothetical protein